MLKGCGDKGIQLSTSGKYLFVQLATIQNTRGSDLWGIVGHDDELRNIARRFIYRTAFRKLGD